MRDSSQRSHTERPGRRRTRSAGLAGASPLVQSGDGASSAWAPLPEPPRHANQAWVRQVNRALVLACIEADGPISRVRIAERTALSRTTISAITTALLREGVIREEERLPSTRRGGRRAVPLRAAPHNGDLDTGSR